MIKDLKQKVIDYKTRGSFGSAFFRQVITLWPCYILLPFVFFIIPLETAIASSSILVIPILSPLFTLAIFLNNGFEAVIQTMAYFGQEFSNFLYKSYFLNIIEFYEDVFIYNEMQFDHLSPLGFLIFLCHIVQFYPIFIGIKSILKKQVLLFIHSVYWILLITSLIDTLA